VGAQLSIPVAISLRQPSGDHGPGARDRQSRHRHASGQEGRLFEKDSPPWRSNADPAIWSVRRPGCTKPESERGPIHFHMLFLDGVYVDRHDGSTRFRWVSSPTTQELTQLSQTIARRVGRYLERQGLLERDADDCMDAGGRATQGAVAENSYLTTDAISEDPMNQLLGHSITYRIAVGAQAGRKVLTLQTLPACEPDDYTDSVGQVSGFSLYAGVSAKADERKKLERLSEGGPDDISAARPFRKSACR
jgi:hypothetical protein